MTALAVVPAQGQTFAVEEVQTMAKAAAASGLFASIKTPEAAFTLMMLCQAEGLHPMQALRQYDIIEGKPAKKADAMLADFQGRGGRVDWKQHDHEACEGVFSAPTAAKPETVRWSVEDAKRAGLMGKQNWQKYTRQMLRARVISEGIRLTMPGVVVGIYTPEEVQDFDDRPARALGPADHDYTPPSDDDADVRAFERLSQLPPETSDETVLVNRWNDRAQAWEPAGKREPKIRPDQLRRIHALRNELGHLLDRRVDPPAHARFNVDGTPVKATIEKGGKYYQSLRKFFGKEHTNELSTAESERVINTLLGMKDKADGKVQKAGEDIAAGLADVAARQAEPLPAANDTGEAPGAKALEELENVFAVLQWTDQQRRLWCKERFDHPPESMTAGQFKTAARLLMAWGRPEEYTRALAEEQGAGRCK